ncbi:hypothetical protein NKH18_41245 [Streptomyces sp. M10(2022)]
MHLTMPGVPDLYQGTEREYIALVDPDNRRPFGRPAGENGEESDEKAAVTVAALRLRRNTRALRRVGDVCPADRAGTGRRALCGVLPLGEGRHRGDPAVAAAGGGGRLALDGPGAPGRGPWQDRLSPAGSTRAAWSRWTSCSPSGRWHCSRRRYPKDRGPGGLAQAGGLSAGARAGS